jgi:UDP:flavonoid glycosyltransferase YjiC (YdhE family)
MFEVDDIVITNFVELDHYARLRPAADLERVSFCGPIGAQVANAVAPPWPADSKNSKRIFAYLKPDYPHLAATLAALAACGEPCVIYGLGADNKALPANAANLHVSAQPIDIARAGAECTMGICHAGGTSTMLLHAGCPLLLLPTQLEQYLEGARISELGAGLVVNPEEKQPDIAGALTRLLADAQFAQHAKEFAARYRAWSPDKILSNTVARLIAAAEGKRLATAGAIA